MRAVVLSAIHDKHGPPSIRDMVAVIPVSSIAVSVWAVAIAVER